MQECHPDQCNERVEMFGQTAGINNVFIAAPYTPAETVPVTGQQQTDETRSWLNGIEIISIALIAILALAFYFVHIRRH